MMNKFFSFHGRIGRLSYFLNGLVVYLGLIVAMIAGVFFTQHTAAIAAFGILIIAAAVILAIAACISLTVRRLHDLGYSGWFALAFMIAGAVGEALLKTDAALLGIIVIGVYVLATLALVFMRGSDAPNAYGPSPIPAKTAVPAATA